MKQRVLIIEDDFEIRSTLSHVLEFEGYSVSSAENGAVGLNLLSAMSLAEQPDVILLDHRMPVMDGDQFLRQWRQSVYQKIPVLMLSAGSPDELQEVPVSSIRKPFDVEELLRAIQSMIGRNPGLGLRSSFAH
jgi:two-component system, OmpR family, response regulator MprA